MIRESVSIGFVRPWVIPFRVEGRPRSRFGVGSGSVWARFGLGLGSVRGRFGVGLGSVRVPGSLEAGFCLGLDYSVITKKNLLNAAPSGGYKIRFMVHTRNGIFWQKPAARIPGTPNRRRTDHEPTPNLPQTDPKPIPNRPRTDPKLTLGLASS